MSYNPENATMSKRELLAFLEDAMEDHEHRIKTARSPKAKRQGQYALRLFSSMYKHVLKSNHE